MRNAVIIASVLLLFAFLTCAGGGSTHAAVKAESGATTVAKEQGSDQDLTPAEVAYRSALQFLAAGNFDDAIGRLKTATSLNPAYTEAWTDLGSTLTKIKDYQGGIAAYERALALSPNDVELMRAVAADYLAIDNVDRAEEYYMKVVQKDSLNYEGNRSLGLIHQKKDDADEAIKYYLVALRARPGDAATMGTLSSLYEKKGDETRKMEYLKMAVAADPGDYNLKRLLGAAYNKNKDFVNAVPIFEELVKKFPDQALYHQTLGIALSHLPDRRADAVAELEKTLELKGDDAFVCGILSKMYADLEQYQKSIDTAKRGLSAASGGQETLLHYQLGFSLSKLGRYDEATAEFQTIMATTKDAKWLDIAKQEIARQEALKKRTVAPK